MRLTLRGTQRYWFHESLVEIIRGLTQWDAAKTRQFLAANAIVNFDKVQPAKARDILDRLERAGFTIQLEETKELMTATVAMTFENELRAAREDMAALSARLTELEKTKGIAAPVSSIRDSALYQKLASAPAAASGPAEPEVSHSAKRESDIGKFWLSRIGIFTLVLGVVFFITYSIRSIGPWGKVATGAAVGLALVAAGNYAARKEEFRRWAMAMVGGGWAVLYFTAYAAYAVPITKVIASPLIGFLALFVVSVGSIAQSLKFNSGVMAAFSYLLAYVALVAVEITFYTLAASGLLAFSIVVSVRRTGWTWLALLGLAAVYLTHVAWLAPQLSVTGPHESWIDAFFMPWMGGQWSLYPVTPPEKSLLHLSFLALYWLLFTAIGFFAKQDKKGENEAMWLLLANNFLFCSSFIHHLHVYYPDVKFVFPLTMGVITGALSVAEHRVKRPLLADLQLASSLTLFALAIPMYFDGPWITYGWCAGFVITTWLGVRHARAVLYRAGLILAALVYWRLILVDFRENEVLFHLFGVPVFASFFLFLAASIGSFVSFAIWRTSSFAERQTTSLPRSVAAKELRPAESRLNVIDLKDQRTAENLFLIAGSIFLAAAFCIGGPRAVSSVLSMGIGVALLRAGVLNERKGWGITGVIFAFMSAARMVAVDCAYPFVDVFSNSRVALRLGGVILAIFVALSVARRLRRRVPDESSLSWKLTSLVTLISACVLVRFCYQPDMEQWISVLWGTLAFAFIIAGFTLRDRVYRWCGLGIFAIVLFRLFFHDFAHLETIYRIVSFIGLGVVFISASFLYSYYSKRLK